MIKFIFSIYKFTQKCREDNIAAFAAQSAFFMMVSFIPFLLVISSILRYTPVTEDILVEMVQGILPSYLSPFLVSIIDEVYTRSIGIVSLTAVVAIWSSAKGIQYVSYGLNVVHGIPETRNWLVLRIWATIYTFGFVLALVALLVLIIFGNQIQDLVVEMFPILTPLMDMVIHIRYMVVLPVLSLFFVLFYRLLPNGRKKEEKLTIRNQLPGAILCAGAVVALSFGISVYVDYFHGFSMYGNLTTLVLVMLWLYSCMYIFLICAECNVFFAAPIRTWFQKKSKRKSNGKTS